MRWVMRSLFLAALFGSASFAEVEAVVVPGDSITGDLVEGDADRLCFHVAAPLDLTARVSAAKGLSVALELEGPSGDAIDISGALRGSPGRKAQLGSIRLATAGRYYLRVRQDSGVGTYKARLTLRAPASAKADITSQGASGDTVLLGADGVRVPGGVAGPSARRLDAVLGELHAGAAAAASSVADLDAETERLDGALGAVQGDVTAVEGDVATVKADAGALASRVATLEAGLEALDARVSSLGVLRVVGRTTSTMTLSGVEIDHPNGLERASSIRRAVVLSVPLDPATMGKTIVARVEWRLFRRLGGVTTPEESPHGRAVFAEIGSRELLAIPETIHEFAVASPTTLGLQSGTSVERTTFIDTIHFHPDPADVVQGGVLTLYLSAYHPAGNPARPIEAVVSSAVVFAE